MAAVKERPILFSAPMVRAILEGRKTVTRREVKKQAALDCLASGLEPAFLALPGNADLCPYGQPGDRLWLRETFTDLRGTGIEHRPDPEGPLQRYAYAADCPPGSYADEARKDYGIKWKPSIHMPRAACRILLEISDVRVERLQDITYEQAASEGVHRGPLREWCASDEGGACHKYPVPAFRDLWQSVGGNWEANPWVWVVEFKRLTP